MNRRTRPVDDAGFTLIELLVVMIVIAVLAAIAVPVFLNQRRTAWGTAAASDARSAAALIVAASEGGTFPAATFRDDAAISALPAPLDEFKRTTDVGTAARGIAENTGGPGPAGFCVVSYHDRAKAWTMYDSVQGPVARNFDVGTLTAKAEAPLTTTAPCRRLRSSWADLMNASRG